MSELQFRDAEGSELVDGCALLARSLDFADRDALPPWLVQTSAAHGGLALGAFNEAGLVGFSFALPGEAGTLFSCGLAVAAGARGRGIGRRLKLLQAERALARGVTLIRWTADPLSAPALGLYLGALRARLVAYGPDLYARVRPSAVPLDDVVIEWRLDAPGPEVEAPAAGSRAARTRAAGAPGPAAETRAARVAIPSRLAASAPATGAPAARVEIPFDRRGLDVERLGRWRHAVRRAMTDALAAGAVGTGVAVDRSAGRAWVLFGEGA